MMAGGLQWMDLLCESSGRGLVVYGFLPVAACYVMRTCLCAPWLVYVQIHTHRHFVAMKLMPIECCARLLAMKWHGSGFIVQV